MPALPLVATDATLDACGQRRMTARADELLTPAEGLAVARG